MGINSPDIEAVLASHPEFWRAPFTLNVSQPSSPGGDISSRAVATPPTPQPHASAIPETTGGMAHAAPVEEWPTVSAVPPVANHTAEGAP